MGEEKIGPEQSKRLPPLSNNPVFRAFQERSREARVAKGTLDGKAIIPFDKKKFDEARKEAEGILPSEEVALGEKTVDHNHPSMYFQRVGKAELWNSSRTIQRAFTKLYEAFRRGELPEDWMTRYYNLANKPGDPRPTLGATSRAVFSDYINTLRQPKTQVLVITPEEMREYEATHPGGVNQMKELTAVERLSNEALIEAVKNDFTKEGKLSFLTKRQIAAQRLSGDNLDFLADVINHYQAASLFESDLTAFEQEQAAGQSSEETG